MSRPFLALLSSLILLCACAPSSDGPQTLRFWAMGREGEVVAQLLPPSSSGATPASAFGSSSFRGPPRTRSCSPPSPATPCPTSASSATPGCRVRRAGGGRAPGRAHRAGRRGRADDYFPGIWETNRVAGASAACPGTSTRGVLFYRRDLLAQAGFDDAAAHLGRVGARAGRDQGAGGARTATRSCCRCNEFEPLLALGLQRPAAAARDGGRARRLPRARVPRALAFYVEAVPRRLAPATGGYADLERLDRVRARLLRLLRHRAVEHRRVQDARLRRSAQQDDWMTAPMPGRTVPGASTAGGSSLVLFRRSRHQRRGVEVWSSTCRSPRCRSVFHALTGDLPPRRARGPGRSPRAGDRPTRARSATSSSACARAGGAGVGAHRARDAALGEKRRSCAATRPVVRRLAELDRARRRDPREAPLDARARKRRMKTRRRGWVFVAPALVVIGVFFVLPVAAAFALSFTDFDIYALADPGNLRFVGLRNYSQLLHDAAVLEGARQHALLRRASAGRCRSRVSLGAALLLHSTLARFKAFFRTALLRAGGDHARRGGDRVALPLPPALRAGELGARRARHATRSTGSATRTGRCRRSSCSRCGRTSATTC